VLHGKPAIRLPAQVNAQLPALLPAQLPAQRSHCAACAKALSRHERYAGGGFCGDVLCRHRRLAAQRKAELDEWMRCDRDAAAAAVAVADPGAARAPIVVVRWSQTPLEPVPPEQREALRVHLMALQGEVEALLCGEGGAEDGAQGGAQDGAQDGVSAPPDDDQPLTPSPAQQTAAAEVDTLLGQVCAQCTGYCCRLGAGRHAFLDAQALLAARQHEPARAHAALVDSYLAALPERHHAGSCGFHGEHGCVLPRQRRAAICNSYECPGLEQARGHAEQDGVRRVYVVRHFEADGPEGGFAPPYGAV